MRAFVICGLLAAAIATPAAASDFWDEVRTPGSRQWRLLVTEGRAALRARRFTQALEAATSATGLLPERAVGHVLRGRALGEMGRADEAVAALRLALDHDETALDDPEDGAHAARLVAYAGDHALAARVLERVLGRMTGTALRRDLYVLQGDVLLSLGPDRLREAALSYREALRSGHQMDVRAGLGLALALRRLGERVEADDTARAATGRGRVDGLVAGLPIPAGEKAARRAIALDAIGDAEGARLAWAEVRDGGGPWAAHAQTELAAGAPPRPRPGRRGRPGRPARGRGP